MECLGCGNCCVQLSPFSDEGVACPYLKWEGDIAVCTIYAQRPKECREHEYANYRYCPIGVDVLKIAESSSLAYRCDRVYALRQPA